MGRIGGQRADCRCRWARRGLHLGLGLGALLPAGPGAFAAQGGEITAAAGQYNHWLALVLVLLMALVIYLGLLYYRTLRLNHRLQQDMAARARRPPPEREQDRGENEQRLAAILDNILEAVVTSDFAGNIQTFNRAAEQIFGYRQEEVLGRNVVMLMPQRDARQHGRYIDNYIRTGETKIIGLGRESEGLRKDGEVFPLELAVSEVSVRGERMFVAIMRDLSERKAHDARRRQVERLDAVARMAGGFAHEFNNLLSSIVGYTDMLQLEAEEKGVRCEDLARVMDAAVRAKLLVKQLLDISRSDYEVALVHMPRKIVEEAVELLHSLLPAGAEIQAHFQRCPCKIHIPPLQFQQIVMNLGVNAVEALDAGGHIDIKLGLVELDAEQARHKALIAGAYAVLHVCDDGKGIAPEKRASLFEPAFSNHDAVKDQVIGLAAVQGIVSRHKGVIEVESEPGEGACFRVYLPCAAPAATAPHS